MISRHRLGFTLVELSVAMALGALILTGLLGVFQSISRSFSTGQNLASLNGAALYAESTLADAVHQAGARTRPWAQPQLNTFEHSIDRAVGAGDELFVRRWSTSNCLGNPNSQVQASGQPEAFILESNFRLRNGDLVQTCHFGPAGGPLTRQINNQTVVENIDYLQFEYLEVAGSGTAEAPFIQRWVGAGNWLETNRIEGVRFALVVTSPDRLLSSRQEPLFLLSQSINPPDDGRLRIVFERSLPVMGLWK